MEPTTLRLSKEMQEELDREAERYGYTSRSEYIRFLLKRRELVHQQMIDPSDSIPTENTEQNRTDREILKENQSRLAKLEKEVEQLKSEAGSELPLEPSSDQTEGNSEYSKQEQKRDDNDTFQTLERWLSEGGNGPSKKHPQNILLEAMKLLDRNGPLQKKELLDELYNSEDSTYKNKDTFWRSTVDEHYEDIPGFTHPQKGQYDFDKRTACEEIDLSPDLAQWNSADDQM
jgi:Arc/MetJ-type ribon-helix-helix transcriptional regulator